MKFAHRLSTKTFALFLLSALFVGFVPSLAQACSGTCASDSDCSSNACAYCDTTFSRCSDCCEFVDQADCPPACTWNSGTGDCRNSASLACGVTVPETPRKTRSYFLIGLLIAFLGLAGVGALQLRRKRSIKDLPPKL